MKERLESFAEILLTAAVLGFGFAFGAWSFVRCLIAFDGGLW